MEIFSRTHFRSSFLNVTGVIPDLITSGSKFHRLAPRTKKALFEALSWTFGTLIVLRRRWLNTWPSIGFLNCRRSARYLGFCEVTTLKINIKVWNAVNWWTDNSLVLLRSIEVEVSRPSLLRNLRVLFCKTCSRRLSSFVKDIDLLFISSRFGRPQTFPKSWIQ